MVVVWMASQLTLASVRLALKATVARVRSPSSSSSSAVVSLIIIVSYVLVNINECANEPCLNEGRCTDLINAFRCSCVAGYTGETCESTYMCALSA